MVLDLLKHNFPHLQKALWENSPKATGRIRQANTWEVPGMVSNAPCSHACYYTWLIPSHHLSLCSSTWSEAPTTSSVEYLLLTLCLSPAPPHWPCPSFSTFSSSSSLLPPFYAFLLPRVLSPSSQLLIHPLTQAPFVPVLAAFLVQSNSGCDLSITNNSPHYMPCT